MAMADPARTSSTSASDAQSEDEAPEATEPLPDGLVEALGDPAAHPEDPEVDEKALDHRQTHISHLFFAPTRVYKLRKAVSPGFLDFSTREARNRDCLREVELNRRLAPEVYLGVAPIRLEGGEARVGTVRETIDDETCEHCVVMERLPSDRDGVALLEQGALDRDRIDAIARTVADFHREQTLGEPAPRTPVEWLDAVSGPVEDNLEALAELFDDERPDRLAARARAFLAEHADRFERRRRDGRAVDGHGDLRLEHVFFPQSAALAFTSDGGGRVDGRGGSAGGRGSPERRGAAPRPIFIDCIEFDDGLRRIDAAAEVAFLAMDLIRRGEATLAERFLRQYARRRDDFHLYAVVDYFIADRAAVRAKVAALAAREEEIPGSERRASRALADEILELAVRALDRPTRGALVVLTGIVGTGKSTAAEEAAERLDGVVVSSDRLRKRLAGMEATESASAGVDQGIYDPAHTQRVYRGLLERAAAIVASGRVAILDATHSHGAQRRRAEAFARARGLSFLILETRCPRDVVLDRLRERERRGGDPSDAGPSFYDESVARFADVEAPVHGRHIAIDTADPAWRDDLGLRLSGWREEEARPRGGCREP
jgi:aminoglycoside phosphotransferase family enzyme/predicted kinase